MYATKQARSCAFQIVTSSPAATETDVPALRSPATAATAPKPDEVEYPEGHWVAPSVSHGVAVRQAATALDYHFQEREDVLVAMELVVYFQRGQAEAKLQPDVQVVFGVGRANRSSFKVWEEGKAPDFVLEVASPSTADKDARLKAREYARIGVREYWRLDPDGTLMSSPLEGYVLSGDRYGRVEPVASAGERLYLQSQVLGIELRGRRQAGATVLVFRDPATGEEFDGTLAASDQRRRAAESRASAEAKRASAAEARARAVEARARAVEEQLPNLASHSRPLDRQP